MTEARISHQDPLAKFLSNWRNSYVSAQITPPFLDIACGDNLLARSIAGGVGVDVINHGQADLLTSDYAHLPFANHTFQIITIVASLNYFDDPLAVFVECHRVLKPSGKLIITMLDPMIGQLWHLIREPWAKDPGISSAQIKMLAAESYFRLVKHSRFMLGLNNFYLLEPQQATR